MQQDNTLRILLLVSGMSPQIITETLYALVTAPEPWVPDEIHLVTTQQGRNNAVGQLLHGKANIFTQLLGDYGIAQTIKFDASTIHIIHAQGNTLDDLRTPADNQAAADTITDKIRELTQHSNTELHVSLAGGRKTMGFYAGYALSLFGRPQDRLSHVLVSEPYESSDFYYPAPTPDSHWIKARDGKTLDTHEAKVWLAEIPFVRLRNGLPKSLLEGSHGFSETIELARRATEKPTLILHPKTRTYVMNGTSGQLPASLMALFLWMAVRHQQGDKPVKPLVEGEKGNDYAAELFALADKYNLPLHSKTESAFQKDGVTKSFLETNISKLNNQYLARQLGPELVEHCKLAKRAYCNGTGYALPENLFIQID